MLAPCTYDRKTDVRAPLNEHATGGNMNGIGLKKLLTNTLVLVALISSTAALAQTQGAQRSGDDQEGMRKGPPPEALAACNGKASGASCSFVGRRGEQLSGTCFKPPAGGPPQGSQSQSGNGRPAPGSGNASSSNGTSGRSTYGVSQNQTADKPLACRPTNAPGGQGGLGGQTGPNNQGSRN